MLLYARCLAANGEHERAVRLLRETRLLAHRHAAPEALLLAAVCLHTLGRPAECLALLEKAADAGADGAPVVAGALWLVRGKANSALERRAEAVRCWQAALRCDPLCAEAWQLLAAAHALSAPQWAALYADTKHRVPDSAAAGLVLTFYAAATAEAGTDVAQAAVRQLAAHPRAATHPETAVARAQLLLQQRRPADALQTLREFVPFFLACPLLFTVVAAAAAAACGGLDRCVEKSVSVACAEEQVLLMYVACLMQQREREELAHVAQQLAEKRAGQPVAWFAVGCFWMAQKEYEAARTSFAFVLLSLSLSLSHTHRTACLLFTGDNKCDSKATTADASFGCGWLLFGHTFAACGEHDQAAASYRTAVRLCPASHVPLLCLAQEMLAVGSHADAVQCLDSARELCDRDPLVLNEYGAAAFQQKQFADARRYLEHAESLLTAQMHASVLELVNNNLAHALRCLQFVLPFLSHTLCLTSHVLWVWTATTTAHWHTSASA